LACTSTFLKVAKSSTFDNTGFGSYLRIHYRTRAHIDGSVASLRNTRVGTPPVSCNPNVAVLAVLARVV